MSIVLNNFILNVHLQNFGGSVHGDYVYGDSAPDNASMGQKEDTNFYALWVFGARSFAVAGPIYCLESASG